MNFKKSSLPFGKFTKFNELCQKYKKLIFLIHSQGSPILDNHEEHKKLQEEIDFEEDLATRTRLRKELEGRLKSRQKAAGIVKLIGELFNVELINFRVINLCMKDLLFGSQEPSELDIECFHILMTTTGAKLESLQAGKQIVEKYLTRLDTIINSDLDKYNVRTRFLMLEIFQYRANEWQPPAKLERNPNPDPQSIEDSAKNLPIKSKMIEEIKISKILYQELNDVLLHLRPEELIKFIEHFRKITFQSEDQFKGAVKIIFERLMSAPNMLLLYALICKGLSGVTAPRTEGNGVQVTFEELLMLLIQNEIEVQLKLTETFRQISNNTKALQGEKIPRKAAKLREEVENGFKAQARVHRFTVFLGELFNIDFLGSHFIFEYINQLLDPRTVSSTSVEAFCFLFQSIDRKLFREPNNVNWFKRSLSNLNESMKTFQFSFRSQFMFKDLIDKCRIQWKILSDAGLMKEFSEYSRCDLPWNSTLNEDALWPEEIHKKQESIEESQTNGHASDESVLSYEELSSVQTDLPSKVSFSLCQERLIIDSYPHSHHHLNRASRVRNSKRNGKR